jgi:Flp pilus assembly protein TadG
MLFIQRRPNRAGRNALRKLRCLGRAEDGQAMVELALALPILLIVIFGIVDFGRAINYWNDENSLANVGARIAAVGSIPSADPTCGTKTALPASTHLSSNRARRARARVVFTSLDRT